MTTKKKKAEVSRESLVRAAARLRRHVAQLAGEVVHLKNQLEVAEYQGNKMANAYREAYAAAAPARVRASNLQKRLWETAMVATALPMVAARELTVICVTQTVGEAGSLLHPSREVVTYWTLDGDFLAVRDLWADAHLAEVRRAAAGGSQEVSDG